MSVLRISMPWECTFITFSLGSPEYSYERFFSLFFRHSSGRGGLANLTPEVPYTENAVHPHGADHPHATHAHEYESRGRGGAGNISRDHSQGPAEPRNEDHGLRGLLHHVTHPGTHRGEPVKVKENF